MSEFLRLIKNYEKKWLITISKTEYYDATKSNVKEHVLLRAQNLPLFYSPILIIKNQNEDGK